MAASGPKLHVRASFVLSDRDSLSPWGCLRGLVQWVLKYLAAAVCIVNFGTLT